MLRKIKFCLNRKSINQLYLSFLRPILEYASVVWDSCSQYDKDSLEKIQHEAARIVTGLTRSCSLNLLYKEIGWVSLDDRRKYQKLIMAFKIKHGITPEYLCNIFPESVGLTTPYNLRNNNDITIMNARTNIFKNSFIPSCVTLWNNLPDNIRDTESLDHFKNLLKRHIFKPFKVPSYYLTGNRRLSLLHARLRNKCSNLNHDLFLNHLRHDSKCDLCGHEKEDVEHYFMQCPHFRNERIILFRSSRPFHPISVNAVLFGKSSLTDNENTIFFNHIQTFIKDTKRFDN